MYKRSHVARELVANAAMSIPAIRALRIKKGRTIGVPIAEKASSIIEQFGFFMDTIGLENIRGKTIVEIGPGDAIPLAPLFIGAGAKRYVAIDRFLGDVTSSHALALYDAVLSYAPSHILEGLTAINYSRANINHLLREPLSVSLIKTGIESEAPASAKGADYIVSFNVCEHLTHLERSVANMVSLLAPAGQMIHRVDYGPHDIWQTYANPLAFLTVPAVAWQMMSSYRGCPNRVRHRTLLEMLSALGLSVTDRVGLSAPDVSVAEVRPHLCSEFRDFDDRDLSVLDAEIVCGFVSQPRLGRTFSGETRSAFAKS